MNHKVMGNDLALGVVLQEPFRALNVQDPLPQEISSVAPKKNRKPRKIPPQAEVPIQAHSQGMAMISMTM